MLRWVAVVLLTIRPATYSNISQTRPGRHDRFHFTELWPTSSSQILQIPPLRSGDRRQAPDQSSRTSHQGTCGSRPDTLRGIPDLVHPILLAESTHKDPRRVLSDSTTRSTSEGSIWGTNGRVSEWSENRAEFGRPPISGIHLEKAGC